MKSLNVKARFIVMAAVVMAIICHFSTISCETVTSSDEMGPGLFANPATPAPAILAAFDHRSLLAKKKKKKGNTCSSGQYSKNGSCKPCTKCGKGKYVSKKCSSTANTVCKSCTKCGKGDYVSKTCSSTANTVCKSCTKCGKGDYVSKKCSSTANTVCKSCTKCGTGDYVSKTCSSTANTVCKSCTKCGTGDYVSRKCSSTANTVCKSCTKCGTGDYVSRKCTSTANTVCSPCTASCSSGEYVDLSFCTGTTSSNDAVCTPCTAECTADEFLDTSACSGSGTTNEAVCKESMKLLFDHDSGSGSSITLPLAGTVDVVVDWGDGSDVEPVTEAGLKSRGYTAPTGEVTVKISGSMTGFGSSSTIPNYDKLVGVESFGELGITDWSGAFRGASNLVSVPSSIPSGATNMSDMFYDASSLNQDIGLWDVSSVTDHDAEHVLMVPLPSTNLLVYGM